MLYSTFLDNFTTNKHKTKAQKMHSSPEIPLVITTSSSEDDERVREVWNSPSHSNTFSQSHVCSIFHMNPGNPDLSLSSS